MMLEPLLADVAQQLLQLGDVGHASAAEGFERITGELAFSDITADAAMEIVGGEAREAHCAGLDAAHAGAEGVLLPYCAGNDRLEIHDHVLEKMLRQLGEVKAHALVRIAAVVVIPVQ